MKLICPNNGMLIPKFNINIQEGVAYCSDCDEYFKIADLLNSEDTLSRIEKPQFSQVQTTNTGLQYTVVIPPAGWNTTAIALAVFGGIWLFATTVITTSMNSFELFLLPFLFMGLVLMGVALFISKAATELTIDPQEISVKWSAQGLNYTKRRVTSNLKKITETVIYTKNYEPVYGIGLIFSKESKLSFGSKLNDEERKWLIGELHGVNIQMTRHRNNN